MAQATITTPRLELRPLSAAHAEILVELNSDPSVTRYVHSGRPLTREEALVDHAERLGVAQVVPGLGYWMGYDRNSDEAVGWWALTPGPSFLSPSSAPSRVGDGVMTKQSEDETREQPSAVPAATAAGRGGIRTELGYRLLPRYWRRGLATEGGRALVRHGFTKLEVGEVYGQTMAVNAASRATMAACGLVYRRTFHLRFDDEDSDQVIPGTEEGEVEYAARREEWLSWDAVIREMGEETPRTDSIYDQSAEGLIQEARES